MGNVIADMTMSVDGFIADPEDAVGPLFDWYSEGDRAFAFPGDGMAAQVSEASARHLQGMVDSASLITYNHLAPWLQGNLVLVDLMFNFDDSQNNFETQLDNMLQDFEEGDYKEYVNFYLFFLVLSISITWTRFLVVISTHSDPCTGDLHIAPGNTGSVPVDEVSLITFFVIILNF